MTANRVAVALALGMAVVLAWRGRPPGQWRGGDRLGAALVPLALLTVCLLAAHAVIGTVGQDWNGARLAPTFALFYGYRLYYPATEGPILDTLYGPVAALAFLPATIFRTPVPAILAGGVLEVGLVFGALLGFVLRAGGRDAADRLLALGCGLAACVLMMRYPASRYWVTMVHADGPALALGILGCAALASGDGAPPGPRGLALSATAVVLACWAKQTVAPLPLALVLWLGLAHGRAVAARYLLAVAVVGVILSTAFLLWLGEPMIFNMVDVVRGQAWYQPGLGGLVARVRGVARSVWELPVLIVLATTVVLACQAGRNALAQRPWVLVLLAAAFLLPTGALGANKVGGSESSFHSVYYLIAALAALLVDAGRRTRAARVCVYACCTLVLVDAWRADRAALVGPTPPLDRNNHALAYAFARAHPGEAYFPWQPLASLLAEGRLYHFEYGLLDRFLAGYEATPEHLRAHLPPRLRWVAAPAKVWTFHYFPEYSEEVAIPELPGWSVRVRPPP